MRVMSHESKLLGSCTLRTVWLTRLESLTYAALGVGNPMFSGFARSHGWFT